MCKNKWYFCTLPYQMVLWSIPECISGAHISLIQSAYDMSALGSSSCVHDHGQLRMPQFQLSRKSNSRNMQMIQVWGNGPWISNGFVENKNPIKHFLYAKMSITGFWSGDMGFHGQWWLLDQIWSLKNYDMYTQNELYYCAVVSECICVWN